MLQPDLLLQSDNMGESQIVSITASLVREYLSRKVSLDLQRRLDLSLYVLVGISVHYRVGHYICNPFSFPKDGRFLNRGFRLRNWQNFDPSDNFFKVAYKKLFLLISFFKRCLQELKGSGSSHLKHGADNRMQSSGEHVYLPLYT